jgi:hypothetical protein
MTIPEIKARYNGIQTMMKNFSDSSCNLLSLCTIIEEITGKPADLIGIVQWGKSTKVANSSKNIIDDDWTVNDNFAILSKFSGKTKWKRTEVTKLPDNIKDNQFTFEIWKKKPTDAAMHVKRRFVDTLINSQTVKIGSIVKYYIYEYLD